MKRVLLTGASGYIGKPAIASLLSRGFEVHAVSSKATDSFDEAENLHWHCADLLDSSQTEKLLAEVQPSHLLHLAWYVEHGKVWTSPQNFRWVEASLALLRIFQANGGQRVVMAGTCAEYDWNCDGDFSETKTPLNPQTTYGVCKNSLRMLAERYSLENDLSFAWGRIFFLYGENEPPQKLIASTIISLLKNEPAHCRQNKQIRDFLYVKDVADAFAVLLESEFTGSANIASGQPITLGQIVEEIGGLIGKSDLISLGNLESSAKEPPKIVAATELLNEEIGWHPNFTIQEGLGEVIEWWKTEIAKQNK